MFAVQEAWVCSVPGLGRSPGEGKGYPLQYSGLENSMNCIMGSQRVGHNWATFHFLKFLHLIFITFPPLLFFFILNFFGSFLLFWNSSKWNSRVLNLGGALGILWFCRDSEPEDGAGGQRPGTGILLSAQSSGLPPEGGLHMLVIELGWSWQKVGRRSPWVLAPYLTSQYAAVCFCGRAEPLFYRTFPLALVISVLLLRLVFCVLLPSYAALREGRAVSVRSHWPMQSLAGTCLVLVVRLQNHRIKIKCTTFSLVEACGVFSLIPLSSQLILSPHPPSPHCPWSLGFSPSLGPCHHRLSLNLQAHLSLFSHLSSTAVPKHFLHFPLSFFGYCFSFSV